MDSLPRASAAADKVRILVCATCRAPGSSADDERPGARLGASLADAVAADAAHHSDIEIELVECLSVCKRPCTVAISAEGRWTYIYGDLDPVSGTGLLLDFVHRYRAVPDGIVPWRERPEAIRKGVIARLPPLPRKVTP